MSSNATICNNSGADKCNNRAFGETSMKIGMNILHGILCENRGGSNQNFKMAAVFQDGRHFGGTRRYVPVNLVIKA